LESKECPLDASQVSSVDAGGTFAASDAGQELSANSRNLTNQIEKIPMQRSAKEVEKNMSFPVGPIRCHAFIAACCTKPRERYEISEKKTTHDFWRSVR